MNLQRIARPCVLGLVFALAATGAWAAGEAEGETAAVDKPMITDPTTGKMLTAPEYGGTLTYPYKLVASNTDPDLRGHYAGWLISAVNEKLALGDWAAPPRPDEPDRVVRADVGIRRRPGRELGAAG